MYKHTSKGKNPAVHLGDWVQFDFYLKREEENRFSRVTRRQWVEYPCLSHWPMRDRRGIVAGTRTFSNGKYEYAYGDSDEPPTYTPDEYFEVAVVYTSLRKKPVFVRLDRVRPLEV